MTNFDMPNNVSSMKYALKSVPGLADVWVPHGVEDGPRTLAPGSGSKMYAYHIDQHEKLKGLGGSNFYMPNNISSMKYALKSVPDLADVGVPHGVGDGPRAPPRSPGGPEKNSND